jgi:cell division protein FtsQ
MAKRSERERRLSEKRRQAQLRIVGGALAVLILVGAAVAIYRSPLFSITRVEIVGTEHMSRADVVRLAAVPVDATLIRFPADQVVANIERDPRVESVAVSRVFPDAMRIRVVERTPIAVVDTGSATWLVDAKGFVIAAASGTATGSVSTTPTAGLPLVRDVPGLDLKAGRQTTSEPLLNVVAVLSTISAELRSQVTGVSAPDIDSTTLYTTDKVEIVFGSATDAAKKDAIVLKILADQRGKVVSIDVRTTDRPTWRGLPN